MPSVRYFNQTAPFWDFVANLEDQGASHPFFGSHSRDEASENENEGTNPWTEGWAGFPWGPFPHRGRHGPHPHPHPHPPPPPPPPHHEGPAPPPPAPEGESDHEAGPSDGPQHERGAHRRGRRDHHQGHGPWRGHPGMGGRGGHCGRGPGRRSFHPYAMGPLGGLAGMFQNQFFGGNGTGANDDGNNNEFTPEVDVFDAAEAFVIHVSLPGAKKEDVAVSWDAEKSELAISGVVHRPGDEELLKTLALNERKVGAFERKVRLGSRANPAQVEADNITARMEEGVLRVEVPKLDAGYVEIKKVDIE